MTRNELIEILNKTRRTPNISLTPEQVKELIKDLKVLEILKVESCVIWLENGKLYSGRYADIHVPLDEWDFNGKENQEVIEEWLEK